MAVQAKDKRVTAHEYADMRLSHYVRLLRSARQRGDGDDVSKFMGKIDVLLDWRFSKSDKALAPTNIEDMP
jgi:hypothetical protein